jgi:hypothetical protein
METGTIILSISILLIVAFFFSIGIYRREIIENIFRDKNLLSKGMDLPVIWLYYDTSDVNSRWWADFGQRSSRAINVPYLNLCYESIVEANKGIYRVEIISGLSDAASRLGGWNQLPRFMQNPLVTVGPAELNWLRAEFLSRFGGLWVSPSIICLKPFNVLQPDVLTFYGTDMDETYSGKAGTTVPGFAVMGILKAGDERLEKWSNAAFERLDEGGGGKQIRGDAKWDYTAFATGKVQVYSREEISRKSDGRRIQLEDLLAAGQDGSLPFAIPTEGIYVLIPWEEMKNRRNFGWFLRLSENQILDSDLAISEIFRSVV